MVFTVLKRNGQEVPFDKTKIYEAIMKAFKDLDKDDDNTRACADKIANDISNSSKPILSVEEIQDIVEKKLMSTTYKEVAKNFINYRYLRKMANARYTGLVDAIMEKLSAKNVQNQNANVDEHSFGGRVGEASSVVNKKLALDYMVSPMARENHEGNMIYEHDLDAYAVGMHNCLSIPFDDLLAKGFNTRQTDVRPAGSINTAMQLVAVIFQLQSLQQFGGVASTHIDWTMVPYVRKSFFKHYLQTYAKQQNDFLDLNLEDMFFANYDEKIKITTSSGKEVEVNITRNKFDDWVDANKQQLLDKLHLTKEDFTLENKDKLDPILYQSALYDTIIETKQAAEGLFHNLNTLQSRSGNQLN